jgi:hypothetical protein
VKPKLKALRYTRLKLTYDDPLSSFAFKFNLRRYTAGFLRQFNLHTRFKLNIECNHATLAVRYQPPQIAQNALNTFCQPLFIERLKYRAHGGLGSFWWALGGGTLLRARDGERGRPG